MRESLNESAVTNLESLLASAGDEFLSPKQAMAEAGLKSVQTIYNWINDESNPLPADKAGRKLWRIRRSHLLAYMRAHGNRPQGERESFAETAVHRGVTTGVRVARAALEYKRACMVYWAATETYDLEWHEQSYEQMYRARESLFNMLEAVSDQGLKALEGAVPLLGVQPAARFDRTAGHSLREQT